MVSDAHIPSNQFLWNILSDQDLCDNGITAYHISHCVIILSVSFACSIPICYPWLISMGDTYEWRSLDYNVFACGTS